LLLDKVQGELYYGFAETDQSVPEHAIPELKRALERADTKYKLEVLSGTQHGFCFAERAMYHPQAAEQAWTRLFDLGERNLKH
jgi:carboxymethylenebutenolidase